MCTQVRAQVNDPCWLRELGAEQNVPDFWKPAGCQWLGWSWSSLMPHAAKRRNDRKCVIKGINIGEFVTLLRQSL